MAPLRTEHERLPANTTHRHQAQPEDTGPAPGGRSLRLCGRLLKFFRVSFRALLYIPIRATAKRPGHTPSVSQGNLPFRILPVACRFNRHPEQTPK